MISSQPLIRRIVIAFTLMTLVVSAFFSISIVVVVYVIEGHLISETLDRELNAVLERDIKESSKLNLPLGLQFYTTENKNISLPDKFRETKESVLCLYENNQQQSLYACSRSE